MVNLSGGMIYWEAEEIAPEILAMLLFRCHARNQVTTGLCPEEELIFHLRIWRYAERMELTTNGAAGGCGRRAASIGKSFWPEALCQIPDVGVCASRATCQINFAD